jgi:hypothetical protein
MTTRQPRAGCHQNKLRRDQRRPGRHRRPEQLIRECEIRIGICEETSQTIDMADRGLWHAQAPAQRRPGRSRWGR